MTGLSDSIYICQDFTNRNTLIWFLYICIYKKNMHTDGFNMEHADRESDKICGGAKGCLII